MKKVFKVFLLLSAFTTASFLMSCADTIPEDDKQPIENHIEESAVQTEEQIDYSRHCFGGHNGHSGGNSISDGSCHNRGGRNNRDRRSGRGRW